jgi:hypothetical protein
MTTTQTRHDTHVSDRARDAGKDANMPEKNTPQLPERDVYTPHDIAVVAFGAERAFQGGKIVRDWLRATYTRPREMRNTSWLLSPEVAQQALDAMLSRRVETVVTTSDAVSDTNE